MMRALCNEDRQQRAEDLTYLPTRKLFGSMHIVVLNPFISRTARPMDNPSQRRDP